MFEFCNQLASALEARMQNLYETLSEKDRRRFVAFQSQQLGHGSMVYLSLNCVGLLATDDRTRRRGTEPNYRMNRLRAESGARAVVEKKIGAHSELEQSLSRLLSKRTASNPDAADIVYRDLCAPQLSAQLSRIGMSVSSEPIRRWMLMSGAFVHMSGELAQAGCLIVLIRWLS